MSSLLLVTSSRDTIEKMIRLHCRKDKYKLDNGVRPRPVPMTFYTILETHTVPLLLYHIPLGSSIHPDHVDAFPQRELRCPVKLLVPTRG